MNKFADGHSITSVENFVLTVTQRSVAGLEASASVVQIIESLVWPFVARRSERKALAEFSSARATKWFDRFVNSMRVTTRRLIEVESEDNREQSFCKYWLAILMCRVFTDHQRPARDDWIKHPLFSGLCASIVNRMIGKRDLSFIFSLAKGSKSMWPKLGEVKEAQALKKHLECFSRPFQVVPDGIGEMICFTSREIFKNPEPALKFMPTGSACLLSSFEEPASRRDGGALNCFSRFHPNFESQESIIFGRLRAFDMQLNRWRNTQYSYGQSHVFDSILNYPSSSLNPIFDLKIVSIPEPGKFRIISEGNGYLYTVLQPFQGKTLGCWKKCRASTMLTDDLSDRVGEMDRTVKLPFWCSVDYESATDLLMRDATIKALVGMIEDPQHSLAAQSFSQGRGLYPSGEVATLGEGQPMGHPLSFALLCVINLAVYRYTLEKWCDVDRNGMVAWGSESLTRKRVIDICWHQVLVNGDDMLFKCNQEMYDLFMPIARSIGFKISMGKNYLSPDTCMINSQVFRRVGAVMQRRGYLNMKLVKGISLKNGESASTPTQIGKDLSKMADLCRWTKCSFAAAFRRWKQDWYGPFYRPNWFLPVHLGGFGIDPAHAVKIHYSRSQRKIATLFMSDPTLQLYRSHGLSKEGLKIAMTLAKWKMVVGAYVPNEIESSSDPWLARIAYANRACQGVTNNSDIVVTHKFSQAGYIVPMSIEGIERNRQARLYASSALPFCAPLGQIKIRALPYDL